ENKSAFLDILRKSAIAQIHFIGVSLDMDFMTSIIDSCPVVDFVVFHECDFAQEAVIELIGEKWGPWLTKFTSCSLLFSHTHTRSKILDMCPNLEVVALHQGEYPVMRLLGESVR